MRPRFNIEMFCDYVLAVYDMKEKLHSFEPFFRATRSNAYLRSLRNLVKYVQSVKIQDGIWCAPSRGPNGDFIPLCRGPYVVRIHKAWGKGWLRISYQLLNRTQDPLPIDSDVDESTVELHLIPDDNADVNVKGEEVNLTQQQRRALYLLVSGRLRDLWLRPLCNV